MTTSDRLRRMIEDDCTDYVFAWRCFCVGVLVGVILVITLA